jgi:hypothetical protein
MFEASKEYNLDNNLYKKLIEKLNYLFFLCNRNGVVSYCSKTEYADIGQVLTLLEGSDKKKVRCTTQELLYG